LRELVAALKLEGEISTPNECCAQLIVERLRRGTAARFLTITLGAERVMWSVGNPGRGTLYGDARRGKTPLSQFVTAISATIDRSFNAR
jgi:hypothetical protein